MKGNRMDAGNADGVFPAFSHARLGVCGHPSLGVLLTLPWPYTPKPVTREATGGVDCWYQGGRATGS